MNFQQGFPIEHNLNLIVLWFNHSRDALWVRILRFELEKHWQYLYMSSDCHTLWLRTWFGWCFRRTRKLKEQLACCRLLCARRSFKPLALEPGAFFPNLKGISIINSNLLTLEAKDLKPFRGLLHLRLLANSLTTLKGDLFKLTLSLRYIDFQRNLIQRVGYGLLKDLQPVVEVADFSNNICINSCASLPRIYGWETAFIRFVTLLEENCIAKSEMLTTEPPPTPDCRLIDSTNTSGECSLRCSLGKEVDEIKSEVTELGKLVKEFGSIPATP